MQNWNENKLIFPMGEKSTFSWKIVHEDFVNKEVKKIEHISKICNPTCFALFGYTLNQNKIWAPLLFSLWYNSSLLYYMFPFELLFIIQCSLYFPSLSLSLLQIILSTQQSHFVLNFIQKDKAHILT